jgi:hypothetical protein
MCRTSTPTTGASGNGWRASMAWLRATCRIISAGSGRWTGVVSEAPRDAAHRAGRIQHSTVTVPKQKAPQGLSGFGARRVQKAYFAPIVQTSALAPKSLLLP